MDTAHRAENEKYIADFAHFFESHGPDDLKDLQTHVQGFTHQRATVKVVEILADLSRQPEWRKPLCVAGYFERVLQYWSPRVQTIAENVQSIRFIGNLCIGDETAQVKAWAHRSKVRQCLLRGGLVEVTVGALCNVFSGTMVEYAELITSQVLDLIVEHLLKSKGGGPIHYAGPVWDYAITLVAEVMQSTIESGVWAKFATNPLICSVQRLPLVTPCTDMYSEIMDAVLAMLRDDATQQRIVTVHHYLLQTQLNGSSLAFNKDVPNLDDPLICTCVLFRALVDEDQSLNPPEVADEVTEGTDKKEANHDQLSIMWLQTFLGEMASKINYKHAHDLLKDEVTFRVGWWLEEEDDTNGTIQHLKTCAFQILANMSHTSAVCIVMVQSKIHQVASKLLMSTKELSPALVHATVGFLRNVATPRENKGSVRETGVMRFLLTRYEDAQERIQVDIYTLLRNLAWSDSETCTQLVTIKEDSDEQEDKLGTDVRKIGSLLCDLGEEKAKLKLILTRIIITIIRTLEKKHKARSPLDWIDDTMIKAMLWMVKSNIHTNLATEAWLGIAIMSRSQEGGKQLYNILRKEDDDILEAFKSTFVDRDDDNKARDRENAYVVLHQLIQSLDEPGAEEVQINHRQALLKMFKENTAAQADLDKEAPIAT